MRSDNLPPFIEAGWVNLEYSHNQNRDSPDLLEASPGAPYFVGTDKAVPGQWVRLVFDARCWCVGEVSKVEKNEGGHARSNQVVGSSPVGPLPTAASAT